VTQSRSADAVPATGLAAQRIAVPALARWNRRVAAQLIVLIAIPAILALTLTGLWVTHAARSAGAYGQVGRLATLSQRVTGLARAMADERSGTAAFISAGRPPAGLPALHRQYAITDSQAAWVRLLASGLGHGYPARARAGVAQVLASIAKLPGLRRQAAQPGASALAVIDGYAAAAAGLFPVNDGIADLSGDATLGSGARALGALSRMIDHASQQQAILGMALAAGRFAPGALTALTTAQARQDSDLAAFRGSATPEESWALTQTLARPPARQAEAVEQRAIVAGPGALALGPRASQQWSAGMSYTVGWMRQAERQLSGWVTSDAQGLQRGAMRSAVVAGGAGLAVLVLVLLGTLFAARSVVRRMKRLEAAALDGTALDDAALDGAALDAEADLPGAAGEVPAGFLWRNHALLARLLHLIDSSELDEEDPERLASLFEMDHLATRVWRNSDSALVLAGHETPRLAEPLMLVDLLRAAASEIEEYGRVVLDAQPGVAVVGSAATDTVHLLAELLENATTFSPDTAEVIVSGHAVSGGGSLITIADSGPGMSEEELALFNWQLANASPADMAVSRRMGLFAVALLAARHGITVTLIAPPGGGTTAEVYLPAALILLGAGPGGRPRRGGEAAAFRGGEAAAFRRGEAAAFRGGEAGASRGGEAAASWVSEEASARVADLPFSDLRFASGPEPPLDPETDEPELEIGEPEAVPVMLGAPLPSQAPGAPVQVAEPGMTDAEPDDGAPIFESVRSGYLQAFGQGLLRFSDQQAGPAPAGWPVRPPVSWGDSGGPAGAGYPAAARPAAVPPPRMPQAGRVHGAAAGQQVPAAESAELARSKLASFQRGSRRARTAARTDGGAAQPGHDD
jgi:signal transduction histidine kinase